MAYGQQAAIRTQTTVIPLVAGTWRALEASTSFPAIGGATTPLTNRFQVKVFNVGTAGATRVGLSYTTAANIKTASHWLGAGQFRVEPAANGLTLYGMAKLAANINACRVIVVEYGT